MVNLAASDGALVDAAWQSLDAATGGKAGRAVVSPRARG
jgi:hypothetical protein